MDGTVEERPHNYRMTTCPHCEREVPANIADMHATICVHRPEMKARIAAALTSDVPGVGARIVDYQRARAINGAADVTTVLRAFGGTWDAVLAAFGLTPRPPKRRPERTPEQQRMTARQREDAAIADVAAMRAAAQQALTNERNRQYGIEVCRVRSLPDGRVAMMIR